MCIRDRTEDVPDARQELLNRLLSGKKLTGRDEQDIRRLWQEAAQLPGIYKMGSRFAGLRPVSIVTHMIFLCVAFHAAFAA